MPDACFEISTSQKLNRELRILPAKARADVGKLDPRMEMLGKHEVHGGLV